MPTILINVILLIIPLSKGVATMKKGFTLFLSTMNIGAASLAALLLQPNLVAAHEIHLASSTVQNSSQTQLTTLGPAELENVRAAAKSGSPSAQFSLGVAYLEGKIVKKDETQA